MLVHYINSFRDTFWPNKNEPSTTMLGQMLNIRRPRREPKISYSTTLQAHYITGWDSRMPDMEASRSSTHFRRQVPTRIYFASSWRCSLKNCVQSSIGRCGSESCHSKKASPFLV